MRISWGFLLALMWLYRSAFSVLGQTVIARVTTLGDSSKYQQSELIERNLDIAALATNVIGIRSFSTVVTEQIGSVFSRLFFGNTILINIGFQTIAFVGIVAFLASLRARHRLLAAAILLLPSFTLWSSIASKEAIVVFAVGLIGAHIVKQFRRQRRSFLLLMFSLLIVAIFKNHYLPAILFLTVGIAVARHIKQIDALAFMALTMTFVPLYFLKDVVATQALNVLPHFLSVRAIGMRARRTREAFWETPSDVYTKAAEGIALSFFGPTPGEATIGYFQMAAFAESTLLVGVLVIVILTRLPRVPIFSLFLCMGALFWILFANYPFGVMNPGGAVRYRTGYELIVVLIVVFLFSRTSYLEWRSPRGRNEPETTPATRVGAA